MNITIIDSQKSLSQQSNFATKNKKKKRINTFTANKSIITENNNKEKNKYFIPFAIATAIAVVEGAAFLFEYGIDKWSDKKSKDFLPPLENISKKLLK